MKTFHIPELETEIKEGRMLLLDQAETSGQATGREGLPLLKDDLLRSYIGGITASSKGLIAIIYKRIQSAIERLDGNNQKLVEDDQIADYKKQSKTLDRTNKQVQFKMGKTNPWLTMLKLFGSLLALFIMTSSEISFTAGSLQLMGGSYLSSLTFAIGLSLGVLIWAPGSLQILNLYLHKRWQKILFSLASIAFVVAVFAGVSVFRVDSVATRIEISPLYFILFNLFFYLAIALLIHFAFPKMVEIEESWAVFVDKIGINNREKRKQKMKQQQLAIKIKRANIEAEIDSLYKYASALEQEVVSYHEEAINSFKNNNMVYRKDKKRPTCFDDPIPELKLNFQTQKRKAS